MTSRAIAFCSSAPAERRWHFTLGAVLLGALGIRAAALIAIQRSLYSRALIADEGFYHTWASQIAAGTYRPTTAYAVSPQPAYVMAVLYRLFAPDAFYFRCLNVLLGVATCYAISWVGRSLGDRWVGSMACAAAAFYMPLVLYSVVPMKTALSVLWFSVTVALLARRALGPSALAGFGLGAAVGLFSSVRENGMVLIVVVPGLLLWDAWRDRAQALAALRDMLACAAGLALTIVPFAARNYAVAGDLVLTSHRAGFNLYLGNNPASPDPYYRPVRFAVPVIYEEGIQFAIEASRRTGRNLGQGESSGYWLAEVWRFARERPGTFLGKLGLKALALLNHAEAGDHYDIGFMGRVVPFFRLPLLAWWIVVPPALPGLALLARTSRAARWLAAVAAAYGATLVVFFPTDRFRLPLVAILIPCAVHAVREGVRAARAREGRRAAALASAVVACGLVVFLPVRTGGDRTAYYNTYAALLFSTGRHAEALRFWETSAAMAGVYSHFAHLALAQEALTRGDAARATAHAEQIPEDSFAASYRHAVLGDLLTAQGKLREARAAYERCLEINAGLRITRQRLIRVLEQIDPAEAERQARLLRQIETLYTPY